MAARRKLMPEQEAEAVALYEGGMSISQVAAKFGVATSSARSILERNGVTFRPMGDPRHRDIPTERIVELRRRRYSWSQIGRIVNMAPSAARERYNRRTGGKV